jgi:hypothetical protein
MVGLYTGGGDYIGRFTVSHRNGKTYPQESKQGTKLVPWLFVLMIDGILHIYGNMR